jgi:hypothetical protein
VKITCEWWWLLKLHLAEREIGLFFWRIWSRFMSIEMVCFKRLVGEILRLSLRISRWCFEMGNKVGFCCAGTLHGMEGWWKHSLFSWVRQAGKDVAHIVRRAGRASGHAWCSH